MQLAFDMICGAILILSIIVSYFRGFIKETINFFSLVLTFFLSVTQYDFFEQIALQRIHSNVIAICVSSVAVFFLVYLSVTLLSQFVKSLIPREVNQLSVNKTIGAIVGLFKGVSICYIVFFIINFYYIIQNSNMESLQDAISNKNYGEIDTSPFEKRDENLPLWLESSFSYTFLSEINKEIYINSPESFKLSVNDAVKRIDSFLEEEIKNDMPTNDKISSVEKDKE